MCGLCGFVGYSSEMDKTAFTILFMNNILRGQNGCGIIHLYEETIPKKESFFDYIKSELPSSTFISTDEYKQIINKQNRFLAAHTRAATVGEVQIDNNHPFETERLIGMHNGTIKGKFQGSDKFETDSEAAINLIDKLGLKKALETIYKESVNPAYVFVYYDKNNNTIEIIRNEQRPLYFMFNKFGKIFWNSEKSLLEYIKEKFYLSKDEWEIVSLSPHTLVRIFPEKFGKDMIEIQRDFFTPPPPPSREEKYPFGFIFNKNINYDNKHKKTNKEHKNNKEYKKYILIGKRVIKEDVFEKTLEKGCCMCSNPIYMYDDNLNIKFLPGNQVSDFICETCLKENNKESLKTDYGIDVNELVSPEYIKVDLSK